MKYVIIFAAIAVYVVLWAVTAYYLTIDENDDANRALGIDIESREFNGRWYTDVKAWKIEGYADHLGQQEEEY